MSHVFLALIATGSLIVLAGCNRSGYETTDLRGKSGSTALRSERGDHVQPAGTPGAAVGFGVGGATGILEARQVALGPTRVTFVLVERRGG